MFMTQEKLGVMIEEAASLAERFPDLPPQDVLDEVCELVHYPRSLDPLRSAAARAIMMAYNETVRTGDSAQGVAMAKGSSWYEGYALR